MKVFVICCFCELPAHFFSFLHLLMEFRDKTRKTIINRRLIKHIGCDNIIRELCSFWWSLKMGRGEGEGHTQSSPASTQLGLESSATQTSRPQAVGGGGILE